MLHSRYPENDVHYRYGEQGAVANRAGRIMFQEDASGWQTFSYGKLGEVTENIRTFALPNEPRPYTFKMIFRYDSWNRINSMTYPDGEVVSYGYNRGGLLDSIGGQKGSFSHPYIKHIAYNQYELKDSVLYGNGTLATYEWDNAGNMTMHRLHDECTCRLCWDEQNRLLGVKDDKFLSYYQYDANGDRIYKLTGEFARQNRNGDWNYFYWMKRPTLYASPYLVSNEKGYTKHYYAENERIASRIGEGGLDNIDMNVDQELFVVHYERSNNLFNKVLECLDVRAEAPESPLKFLYEWKEIREEEKECYWYHPDHLGSSSWITFSNGKAVEHLHYLPWGEDFVRQRSTDWHAIYTFSAKEKDAETGYSYFGARYYSSDLSVWLSVDPMADKYPSLSPYVYCANNPIKLVDPNGMEAAKPPLHHQFLITVGMQVYKAAKKNGASSNGAILVLAQASLESGWGKSAMRYNDYNLFGVMGTPSKRSTTHGPVKDYSNLGGYEAAINDYFKKAKSRWPKWTAVLSQNDFTSEDIDKALNTGSYYPSKEDRQNGKYAYCGDLDENGESHYGESLIKQFSSTKKRFKDSLIYQINANEKIIQQGIPYSNEYLDRIKEENIQYKSVLDEIK